MDLGLQGQVAMVTGGSRGIGKAIAKVLLEEGANVVIGSRTQSQVDETIRELSKLGNITGFALDVGERKSVQEFVQNTMHAYNRIDILVNSAGINFRNPAETYPEEDWLRVLNINLNGLYRMSQEVGRQMIEQQSGSIINITSMMTHVVNPNQTAYASSKAAVGQYTKALAVEWAKHNIRVNAVSPGYIETELTKSTFDNPDYANRVLELTPQQRFGKPEQVADAVVFLASRRASFITGHILAVDGGFLAGYPNLVVRDSK